MTETEIKLSDARIQLRLALDNYRDPNVLRSCINAFITSARSVTFSMQKESSGSEKFDDWYKLKQKEMGADPVLRFFFDQRNISIHEHSISPTRSTISVRYVNPGLSSRKGDTATKYQFEGYSDLVPGHDANVFSACAEYYTYLESLVREWKELMK